MNPKLVTIIATLGSVAAFVYVMNQTRSDYESNKRRALFLAGGSVVAGYALGGFQHSGVGRGILYGAAYCTLLPIIAGATV